METSSKTTAVESRFLEALDENIKPRNWMSDVITKEEQALAPKNHSEIVGSTEKSIEKPIQVSSDKGVKHTITKGRHVFEISLVIKHATIKHAPTAQKYLNFLIQFFATNLLM